MDACEQKRDHHALISNEASLANLVAELSTESRTDQAVVVEGKVTRRRKFDAVIFLMLELNSSLLPVQCKSGNNEPASSASTLQVVLSGKDIVFPAVADCCTVGARVRCKGKARRGDRGVDVCVDLAKAQGMPSVAQDSSGLSGFSSTNQEHRQESLLSGNTLDGIDSLELVRCAPETAAVERLLKLVQCSAISHDEAEVALGCKSSRLAMLLSLLVDNEEMNADSNTAALESGAVKSIKSTTNSAHGGNEVKESSEHRAVLSIKSKRLKRPKHLIEFAAQARALRCGESTSVESGSVVMGTSSADGSALSHQRAPKRKRPPHVRKCYLAALAEMEAASNPWLVRCCCAAATAAEPVVAAVNLSRNGTISNSQSTSSDGNDSSSSSSSNINRNISNNGSSNVPSNCDLNVPGGDVNHASSRGPLTRGEYFHGRKAPQVRWLVNRLKLWRDNQTHDVATWHVVDVGGGRGDLSLAIAEVFPDAFVTVVDSNETSLQAGQAAATARGLDRRMRFACNDFTSFAAANRCNKIDNRSKKTLALGRAGTLQEASSTVIKEEGSLSEASLVGKGPAVKLINESSAPLQQKNSGGGGGAAAATAATAGCVSEYPWARVDAVVALHACGGLTDHALAFAADHDAPFLVVPCCFNKHPVVGGAAWHHEHRTRRQELQQQQESFANATADARTSSGRTEAKTEMGRLASTREVSRTSATGGAAPAVAVDGSNVDTAAAAAVAAENVVVRLAESDARELSFRAMTTIGTLRLQACQRAEKIHEVDGNSGKPDGRDASSQLENENDDDEPLGCTQRSLAIDGTKLQLSLEAFPQVFSLRNLVLVGERVASEGSRTPESFPGDETALRADAHLF